MRALSIAVLAAWLPAAAAWAGHYRAPIIIVQPRQQSVPVPDTPGPPARLELDVIGEPQALQGTLKRGEVIAGYPVRAADAVILDAPVQATQHLLPAGLALARVEVASPDGRPITIWCDSRHPFFAFYAEDCVQDPADGAPARLWTGHLFGWKDSLGVVTATPNAPLRAGAAFTHHPAKPEERPTGRVGFSYCDGDGVSGPPRFTTAVRFGLDGRWVSGMPYTCTLGVWSNPADHSDVRVGPIRLAVTPGDPMTYRVVEGLAGRRILSAAAGRPLLVEARPEVATGAPLPIPPVPTPPRKVSVLEPTGAPSFVASGVVEPGGELLRVAARYGITGVLQNSVAYSGLFGGRTLPAGHAVYGVPMSDASSRRPSLVWCALDANAAGDIHSVCLPHDGFAYHWVDAPGPFATRFLWSQASIKASAPSVKLTFEDIKTPLDVSYRFVGWRKDGAATVKMSVSTGARSTSEQTLELAPQIAGGVALRVLGADLKLEPTPDGRSARVGPGPAPAAAVTPID